MKLRNKKTGEIWTLINHNEGTSAVIWVSNGSQTHLIESIEELTSSFETKEEAEKAVEKLKAWKRLKDAGVRFDMSSFSDETTITIFVRKKNHIHDYDQDISLLFGGKR